MFQPRLGPRRGNITAGDRSTVGSYQKSGRHLPIGILATPFLRGQVYIHSCSRRRMNAKARANNATARKECNAHNINNPQKHTEGRLQNALDIKPSWRSLHEHAPRHPPPRKSLGGGRGQGRRFHHKRTIYRDISLWQREFRNLQPNQPPRTWKTAHPRPNAKRRPAGRRPARRNLRPAQAEPKQPPGFGGAKVPETSPRRERVF
jgi:hypothetical protein